MAGKTKPGKAIPVVLTIAGSDNSAGAGLQADLKTISAFGCYGLTAATCVVAEVPGRVEMIQSVRPEVLRSQIRLCFEAFPVVAVKTGMLFSAALAGVVAEELALRKRHRPGFHLVVDPVMVASSGDPLLRPGAVKIIREGLFPLADVVTPNLDELEYLAGRKLSGLEAIKQAAHELAAQSATAVLAKGGHLQGREAIDCLVWNNHSRHFSAPFLKGAETHGTGCTYSSAIACGLAQGHALEEAVGQAKTYITAALKNRLRFGKTSALRHF